LAGRRHKTPPAPTAPDHPPNVDIVEKLDWLDTFPGIYEAVSRKNREKRRKARERARQRRYAANKPLTPEQEVFRDLAVKDARSRGDAVEARWRYGHVWGGGAVGGNHFYYRPAQVYRGLVSSEHPLLLLFVSKTHRARRLMTGATKSVMGGGDSKLLALDDAYTVGNAMMRGFLRVDLDDVFPSVAAVFDACDQAEVPCPSIIVGHQRPDGGILKPHLIWLLEKSVTFCGRGLHGPRALWHGVLRGLTLALIPAGADPGALSNPMRVKNPVCPVWSRWIGEERPYSLDDLKPGLNIRVTKEEMAAAAIAHPRQPVEDVVVDPAAGSNAMFVALKEFAAAHAGIRRGAGGSAEEWHAELTLLAYQLADQCGRTERQARARAARVAEYSWTKATRPPLPAEEVTYRQQEAGRDSARRVGGEFEAKVIATYLNLRQQDSTCWPTQAEVAAAAVVSKSTVAKYWREARQAALSPPKCKDAGLTTKSELREVLKIASRSTYDKKGGKPLGFASDEPRPVSVGDDILAGTESEGASTPADMEGDGSRRPPPDFLIRHPLYGWTSLDDWPKADDCMLDAEPCLAKQGPLNLVRRVQATVAARTI